MFSQLGQPSRMNFWKGRIMVQYAGKATRMVLCGIITVKSDRDVHCGVGRLSKPYKRGGFAFGSGGRSGTFFFLFLDFWSL
jgi:hypothetical protein